MVTTSKTPCAASSFSVFPKRVPRRKAATDPPPGELAIASDGHEALDAAQYSVAPTPAREAQGV